MTSYYGNTVGYGSGGWYRVRLDITDGGTDVNGNCTITHTYFVETHYSVYDSTNSGSFSHPWGSGTFNNYGYSTSATDRHWQVAGPGVNVAGVGYGGGSLGFSMAVSGIADGSGGGGTSSVSVAYPVPPRPPGVPDPPGTPVVTARAGTTITVDWTGSPDHHGSAVNAYGIRMSANPSFAGEYAADVGGGPFTFANLTPGTTYYTRCFAHNGVGWSGPSGVTTTSTLAYPSAPRSLAVTNIGPITADVSWTTVADNGGAAVTGYRLQVSTSSNFTTGVTTYDQTGLTKSLTGLDPAVTYYLRVFALTSVGYGTPASTVSFTTLSGAKIRVGSSWVDGVAKARVSGAWVTAVVNKRVSGVWVK